MNLFALVIGIFIVLLIIGFLHHKPIKSSVSTYAWLLFTFPFYYFAFALYAQDYSALPIELVAGGIFFTAPLMVRYVKVELFLKLLAGGYILHGIYDVVHNLLFVNLGTPVWWPEFCGIIDILLGVYLVVYVRKADNNGQ